MYHQENKIPKVMHVIPTLGAGGGAEQLVYNMACDQSCATNRPVICCLHFVGSLGEKLRDAGFQIYFRSCLGGFTPSIFRWLSRIMREEHIDVVHAHTYAPLFYAVPAARLAGGIKVVYTEHGRLHPDGRRWKRYLYNSILAMGAEHIVSISERTREAMINFDNYPADRIRVIHNGVDCRIFRPDFHGTSLRSSLGLDQGSRIIGTAARLEDIKNLPMLFRAFRLVLAEMPDTYLLIAGSGTKEEELKALAARLGIASRIVFLGMRYDMEKIYRLFNVFVLSSFTEGIAVTLLEAMATGIPTVVTDVGGNPEVVVEGETGYLVSLNDDGKMAARILNILKNSELAGYLGGQGRKRVLRDFSFEGMMSEYRTLYGTST